LHINKNQKEKMKVIHIACTDSEGVIGFNGQLRYKFKKDMEFFKKQTLNKCILVGRNTFEGDLQGKPLVGRYNLVLTNRQLSIKLKSAENVEAVSSINSAIKQAKSMGFSELYVIGGSEVYNQTLPCLNEVIMTHVSDKHKRDVEVGCIYYPIDVLLDAKESKFVQSEDGFVIVKYIM
jgi:dihydrofolate reductase